MSQSIFQIEQFILGGEGYTAWGTLRQCRMEVQAREGQSGADQAELQLFKQHLVRLEELDALDLRSEHEKEAEYWAERFFVSAILEMASEGHISRNSLHAIMCLPPIHRAGVLDRITAFKDHAALLACIAQRNLLPVFDVAKD